MATLGILECDVLYPDLIGDYVSYGTMLANLLRRFDPSLTVEYFDVHNSELPDRFQCDAYLLTGSKTGVYDDEPWITTLSDWLQRVHRHHEKLLGICFGHQMLAHTLGGHAGLSDKGWGVGNHMTEVDHRPLWLSDNLARFQLIYSHKDQVTRLPEGAKRLAGSEFCEFAAWYFEDRILSFQGHPEFTPEYFERLLERRREDVGTAKLDSALKSIHHPNDDETIARWMVQFIHLPR